MPLRFALQPRCSPVAADRSRRSARRARCRADTRFARMVKTRVVRGQAMKGRYVRIRPYVKVLLLLAGLSVCASGTASAETRGLSGQMSWWQSAVGSWTCSVKTRPNDGGPIQKGDFVALGSVLPGNVFHFVTVGYGFDFVEDQFDGYSTTKKIWWETQADSEGNVSVFLSRNGTAYDQLSAASAIEDERTKYRENYSFRPDGTFREHVERQVAGAWVFFSDFTCKRVKRAAPESPSPPI